ncbi:FERM domain-containing protein 8 [Podochytrium sp. JEL0797]|nr:FERM domain-containing protein 8 [Podochytrium sp. JEL0797]
MDATTTTLLIMSFGALTCCVILSSLLFVVRNRVMTPELDLEQNIQAVAVPQMKYVPKLTDVSYEINVAPIEKPKLTLSLYTNNEPEDYFRNSAYAATRESRSISLDSESFEYDLPPSDCSSQDTSFSESLKRRISVSSADSEAKHFMKGLASSYAQHYEKEAKKRRSIEFDTSIHTPALRSSWKSHTSFESVCPPHQSISANSTLWAPSVQQHFDPFTNVLSCVSVRVRLLLGDTFLDFHQRFPAGEVKAEDVCRSIVERQAISEEAAPIFALWIVGKDLEIQIRPRANLLKVIEDWHDLVVKYTHFPQAVDPDHMFNRYWLIFRREASLCKKVEREITLKDTIALKMLFGEAKRNIVTGRYPCSVKDAINLAALQLQASIGNCDAMRCPPGYIL